MVSWRILCMTSVGIACGVIAACSSFGATPEGETPDGAAVDGGVDSAEAGPFCSTHLGAALCDDFEDEGLALWSQPKIDALGSLAIVDHALHVTMTPPPHDDAGCRNTYEMADLNDLDAAKGFHLEYKVRPNAIQNVAVATGPSIIIYAANGEKCEYYLAIGSVPTLEQEHNSPTTSTNLSHKIIANEWNQVTIDVADVKGNRHVDVTVNGEAGTSIDVDAVCATAARLSYVQLGLFCVSPDMPSLVSYDYDDVLVTLVK